MSNGVKKNRPLTSTSSAQVAVLKPYRPTGRYGKVLILRLRQSSAQDKNCQIAALITLRQAQGKKFLPVWNKI